MRISFGTIHRVLRILPTWSGLLAILALAFLGSGRAEARLAPHLRFWAWLVLLLVLAAAVAAPAVRGLFPPVRPGSDEARGLARTVAMLVTGISAAVCVVAVSMMLLWPLLLLLWGRAGGGGPTALDAAWQAFVGTVGVLLAVLPLARALGSGRLLAWLLRCGWVLCAFSLAPACFGPLVLAALWI